MGFGFGFGFASVLADFMSDTSSRMIALVSCNIGGVGPIRVMAVVPVTFLLRRQ